MVKRIFLAAVLIVSASLSVRAQEASFGPLQIGTEWRMARPASGGPIRIVTYSVVREETSNGRVYSVVRADELEGWLVRETAALARIVRAGEVIDRFDPDWNDWQWPLAVGKTWVSEFRRTTKGVDLGLARALDGRGAGGDRGSRGQVPGLSHRAHAPRQYHAQGDALVCARHRPDGEADHVADQPARRDRRGAGVLQEIRMRGAVHYCQVAKPIALPVPASER